MKMIVNLPDSGTMIIQRNKLYNVLEPLQLYSINT